jgi:CBS domain-containing protein
MTNVGAVLSVKGSDVATVSREATLEEAAAELARRRIGALVVLDGAGAVVGIVSERDLVQCLAEHGAGALSRSVEAAMTADVITATRDLPVLTALAVMTQRRVRHLPVTAEGRLAGIVSIGDLVKHRMERIEAEADAMRAYIQSA